MSRAIDLCTCGKPREDSVHDHFDQAFHSGDHYFFPNPQPARVEKPVDVEALVLDFLSTLGSVHQTSRNEFNDQIVLTTPSGSIWTIGTPVLRKE